MRVKGKKGTEETPTKNEVEELKSGNQQNCEELNPISKSAKPRKNFDE